MRSIVEKTAGALAEFRKASAAVSLEIEENRQKIEDALQRREELRDAPVSREEFAEKLCEMVDLAAARFMNRLHAPDLFRQELAATMWSESIVGFMSMNSMCVTDLFKSFVDQHGRVLNIDQLCFFFNDRIKILFRDVVARMDYPDAEAGPPIADRRKLLAGLDREIEQLQARETEMIAAAQAAGMKIDSAVPRVR